jgi:hypothetical protein
MPLFILLIVVLVILAIWWCPIFTIWSLNILFGLSIPVTLKTWACSLWLSSVVGASIYSSKD